MPFAKLTARGRVTIPKTIRDRLRLRPGERLQFAVEDGRTIRIRSRSVDLMSLVGMFKADRHVTVEEMSAAV